MRWEGRGEGGRAMYMHILSSFTTRSPPAVPRLGGGVQRQRAWPSSFFTRSSTQSSWMNKYTRWVLFRVCWLGCRYFSAAGGEIVGKNFAGIFFWSWMVVSNKGISFKGILVLFFFSRGNNECFDFVGGIERGEEFSRIFSLWKEDLWEEEEKKMSWKCCIRDLCIMDLSSLYQLWWAWMIL